MRRLHNLACALTIIAALHPMLMVSGSSIPTGCSQYKCDQMRTGSLDVLSEVDFSDLMVLWQYALPGEVLATPVSSDIDSDGTAEIILASMDGTITCLSHNGTLIWAKSIGSGIASTPQIADIDSDGMDEIIFGADDGVLYVLEHDGTTSWTFQTGGRIRSSPVVASMDVFTGPEIVFGSTDEHVYCLNSRGEVVWDFKTGDPVLSSPVITDIDSDGDPDVMIGSEDNLLYSIPTPPILALSYLTNDDVGTPVADPYGYVYVPSGNSIVKLHYTGSTDSMGNLISSLVKIWSYNASHDLTTSPVLGKIDYDDLPDLFFAAGKEILAVNSGSMRIFRYTLSDPLKTTPALADLDNDNVTEAIFGSSDGMVHILKTPGISVWSYQVNCSVSSSPGLADLTGDHTIEFIVGCSDGTVTAFGSWKAIHNQNAINDYYVSLSDLNMGRLDDARRNAFAARQQFERIESMQWYMKADRLVQTIEAYTMLMDAEKLYEGGDLLGAEALARKARNTFIVNNHTIELGHSTSLYHRIEADLYLVEAEYLHELLLYENASIYAEAARKYYLLSDNRSQADYALELSRRSLACRNIKDTFFRSVADFRNGSDEAVMETIKSVKQDGVPWNETYSKAGCGNVYRGFQALELYYIAGELYDSGDFVRSLRYSDRAAMIFNDLCIEDISQTCRDLASKTGVIVDADRNLDLARQALENQAYDNALLYSDNALTLYNMSGDLEGVSDAKQMFNLTYKKLGERSRINQIKRFIRDYTPKIILLFGILFFLTFIVYLFLWKSTHWPHK
ncbi:PQQ-binding-like beta-propeller repeat protein [Candidatus Altiarchaeota archaeon]